FLYLSLSPPTSTTTLYTLSLHDALPIYHEGRAIERVRARREDRDVVPRLLHAEEDFGAFGAADPVALNRLRLLRPVGAGILEELDRKSTRLNSSHLVISYAVFCLKKKK